MDVSIFHIPLIFVEVNIPVIVVFTKYDLLVVEHFRECSHLSSSTDKRVEAANRANRAFREFTKELTGKYPFVPVQVSRKDRKNTQKENGGLFIISVTRLFPLNSTAGAMLLELTEVTRKNLRDVEGSLWALWATAQQINARQKVELSIRYVFFTINIHWKNDTSPIC